MVLGAEWESAAAMLLGGCRRSCGGNTGRSSRADTRNGGAARGSPSRAAGRRSTPPWCCTRRGEWGRGLRPSQAGAPGRRV